MKLVTSLDQLTKEEQLSWLGHPYAIDIETEGLKYHSDLLIGVALYVNEQGYYFALRHSTGVGDEVQEYLTEDELRLILMPVMSQSNVTAILHNSKFDLHWFERYSLPLASRLFDTLIAAQLLDENRKNGLKSLTSLVDVEHVKYEELAEYPQYPKSHPYATPLDKFANYAYLDVLVTFKLYEKFRVEMAKDSFRGVSTQEIFTDLWMPLVPVLQKMEARGFTVDVDEARRLRDKYNEESEQHKEIIQKAGIERVMSKYTPETLPDVYLKIADDDDVIFTDDDGQFIMQHGIKTPVITPTPRSKPRKVEFNIASNVQIYDLIYTDIDFHRHDMLKTNDSGNYTVDVDNLETIHYYMGEKTPEYIKALLDWRKVSKFTNTYLETFINDTDEHGRLHCFFNMAVSEQGVSGGTVTGRLSSSNPNFQNIPSRGELGDIARKLFKAREGHKLIVADYSNMESVIFAHYSEDPVLMKAFGENMDVHALTACGINNLDYDTFVSEYKNGNPEYDAMRRVAKTIFFGSSYGMGAAKFQRLLRVQNKQDFTVEEVRDMLRAFYETYQGMTDWKKKVMEYAGKTGFVATIAGRRRRLPGVFSHDKTIRSRSMRQAVNAIVQGSCADILFQAMVPIQASFEALGGSLVASVHDELVAEVPEDKADIAATLMERLMVDLINPKLKCKLRAEAHAGDTWFDAKNG